MDDITREKLEQDAIDYMRERDHAVEMELQGKKKCKICDEWKHEDELSCGVCDDCAKDIVENETFENVLAYAEARGEVDILLRDYMFDKNELVDLAKQIVAANKDIFKNQLKEFLCCDTYDYLRYLEERGEI